jgi:hypothetical protein
MRMGHVLALAAAVLAVVMTPTAAQAVTRFHADSGDRCRYGVTEGDLTARLAVVSAAGELTDRPTRTDPSICPDDGFFSVATFTAYAGSRIIDQQAVRANNTTVKVDLVLGSASAIARIDRIVIQVCRHPLVTLPPSYCGKAVEYRAPF